MRKVVYSGELSVDASGIEGVVKDEFGLWLCSLMAAAAAVDGEIGSFRGEKGTGGPEKRW